jgi:hypothetical protein
VATVGLKATAFELGAPVPTAEDVEVPPGEAAGLCVEEHPTTATITAPVIAATTVLPGRDRLVMGDCLSVALQALTVRYGTASSAPRRWRRGQFAPGACIIRRLTGSPNVAVTWRPPVGLAEGR